MERCIAKLNQVPSVVKAMHGSNVARWIVRVYEVEQHNVVTGTKGYAIHATIAADNVISAPGDHSLRRAVDAESEETFIVWPADNGVVVSVEYEARCPAKQLGLKDAVAIEG